MNFRKHAQILTMAVVFASAVTSIPLVHAEAHPKGGTPQPVLCAVTDYGTDPPEIVFLTPGESTAYQGKDGLLHNSVCGIDGVAHPI